MTLEHDHNLSFDAYDEAVNPPPAVTDFERVLARTASRRGVLGGLAAFGAAAFVTTAGGLMGAGKALAASTSRLAFTPIAANSTDDITLPPGFNWHPVVKWGEPLFSGIPEFDPTARRGTGESQEGAFGDNNDGMHLFRIDGRNVLVVNNEYTNRRVVYKDGVVETADDVRWGKAAHGVSVMEISDADGQWAVVKDSPYNRRITADTPMDLTGPAAGHDLLKTEADPTGMTSLGTWNNCGNGFTPWGTYLACEENFNGYFSSSDENYEPSAELKRYGVSTKDWGYNWALTDARFDILKNPNEPNRAGYVVEIDPSDPRATPKKRTAMGRFKHENAELVIAADGHVVVYMGDDERGEFLYKFISAGTFASGGDNSDLLEDGDLFVAKFHDDGAGEWLALSEDATGMTRAEIAIHTRIAASKVGATTMDRPEWVTANPRKVEVYCCLTNNKNRGVKPNAGGDDTPVNGPNPRAENIYGQIVRWAPRGGDHMATDFTWSLFVLAGNPTVHDDAYAGSDNVNADNMFNSPDGLAFDSTGLIWIQTDGNYANEGDFAGHGNNQMLVGDPETGEIRRFMVGPREQEVTGFAWSADRKTLFVGIQHPGEKGTGASHWPDGGTSTPRSAVIAIRRDDGGVMG